MKIIRYRKDPGHVFFWCKACNMQHSFRQDNYAVTGSDDKPSVSGVLVYNIDLGFPIVPETCASTIMEGKIKYLDTCTHNLRGTEVEMDDVPTWMKDQ